MNNLTDSKPVISLCRHIKTDGRRCRSAAISGGFFCYFHVKLRRAHRRPPVVEAMTSYWQEYSLQGPEEEEFGNIKRAYPLQDEILFPPLEDAESVQLATSMLFQAIATGQIHFKRARLLINTLKIACINQRALLNSRSAGESESLPGHIIETADGATHAALDNPTSADVAALRGDTEADPVTHPPKTLFGIQTARIKPDLPEDRSPEADGSTSPEISDTTTPEEALDHDPDSPQEDILDLMAQAEDLNPREIYILQRSPLPSIFYGASPRATH
ncbi:MAG TPA: hypothetical protein VN612_12245 [Acidobacteriaceae bacterium]|nr:hypothetical protein [Acidobacteriaceae bacterium]